MDENLMTGEIHALIDTLAAIGDMSDATIDASFDELTERIKSNYTPTIKEQSINQLVNNLEDQRLSRQEAFDAINAAKEAIIDLVHLEEYSEKQKAMANLILSPLFETFEEGLKRYHLYNIQLPIMLEDGAKVPTYAHESDAAADMYAMEDVILPPHFLGTPIKTGVHIQLPEGWVALLLPRSSIGAKTSLRLSNSMGVIDSGYRGEVRALYDNIGDEPYEVHKGDRIAQMLIMPSYRFQPKVVESLEDSDRGESGFGSTGT